MYQVKIVDTTLRDGLEPVSSRISMDEKIYLVKLLAEANVPQIEIGAPNAAKFCLPLLRRIKDSGLKIKTSALVYGFADYDKESEMLKANGIDEIDIVLPLTEARPPYSRDEKWTTLKKSVEFIRNLDRVEVGIGFANAFDTDEQFLYDMSARAIAQGIDRLIIYDSKGSLFPDEAKKIFKKLTKINANCKIDLTIHCHNDRGLATASSLYAVLGGATSVEATVNSIGDRAGNGSFEQIAVNLHLLGYNTGIKLDKIKEISDYVEKVTGIRRYKCMPIVGEEAFTHVRAKHSQAIIESGEDIYVPFAPETFGLQHKYSFRLDEPENQFDLIDTICKKHSITLPSEKKEVILAKLKKLTKKHGRTENEIVDVISNGIK